MVNPSIIEIAKKYIEQIPGSMELKKAYLFGSYAKGMEREGSDIDIALVIGKMDDFFSIPMQLMRLRRNIDLRIEPHPIWDKDLIFRIPLPLKYKKLV